MSSEWLPSQYETVDFPISIFTKLGYETDVNSRYCSFDHNEWRNGGFEKYEPVLIYSPIPAPKWRSPILRIVIYFFHCVSHKN